MPFKVITIFLLISLLLINTKSTTHAQTSTCPLPPIKNSTLHQYAQYRQFNIGALASACFYSLSSANLPKNFKAKQCKQLMEKEFANMRIPIQVSWKELEPQPGKYNFKRWDEYLEFAKQNHMTVHYFHLIWINQGGFTPPWLFGDRQHFSCGNWSEEKLKEIMKRRITELIKHNKTKYPGIVTAYNVVNEAFDRYGNFRKNCFYKKLGPEYINLAFQYARQADPHALLVLNETFGEDEQGNILSGINRTKTKKVFNFVKQAKQKGVPIDAVGLQNHLDANQLKPSYWQNLSYFFSQAKNADIQVLITEMDVYQGSLQNFSNPQRNLANIYQKTLAQCLKSKPCTSFYIWGVYDGKNGITTRENEPHADAKPLLFDDNFHRKPAYYGIMEALRQNETRPCLSPLKSPPSSSPNPQSQPTSSLNFDLNQDQKVDLLDYNFFVQHFSNPNYKSYLDLDNNNQVDIFDYNFLFKKISTVISP